jgi:hypothetical protein
VLLGAIREGVQSLVWQHETFAYADGWDVERKRYLGLRAGQQVNIILTMETLLVKPEVAAAQIAEETAPVAPPPQPAIPPPTMTYPEGQSRPNLLIRETAQPHRAALSSVASTPTPLPTASPVAPSQVAQFHRFHASAQINERMMATDAGMIMEEVVMRPQTRPTHLERGGTNLLSAQPSQSLVIRGSQVVA